MTGCEDAWASALFGSVIFICITVAFVVLARTTK